MDQLLNALGLLNFLNAIWLFLLVFMIHELEEWNIDQFERRNFVGLPPRATDRSARFWIGFVCLVGLIWCAAAALPGRPSLAAWIILPAVALMLLNALQHVIWTIVTRQYAPGLASAVLLLIPLGSYIIVRAVDQGYVPIGYAIGCAALVVVASVQTILAGKKMTPLVRAINNIGILLSEKIK